MGVYFGPRYLATWHRFSDEQCHEEKLALAHRERRGRVVYLQFVGCGHIRAWIRKQEAMR